MAEGFKIADGFVEVHAKYDRGEVQKASEEIGRESGSSHTKGFETQLRDERGRFTRAIEDAVDPEVSGGSTGRSFGFAMLKDASSAFTGGFANALTFGFKGGSITEAFSSNPWTAGIGTALGAGIVAAALPAVGAALSGALIGGSGLGVLAGGIALAARDPGVKKAGGELAKTVMGVNTDTLQTAYDTALAKLATAQRGHNQKRIAAAKADVAKAKKELDDAEQYNATHSTLPTMAIKAFKGPLTASINAIKAGFISITPDISKAFSTVAPALKPLTDGFVGMIKNMMPGFLDMLRQATPFLTSLAKTLPRLGTALSNMFSSVAKGGPGAIKFFQDFMAFLDGQIMVLGQVIGWLSKAYVAVHNFFAKQLPEAFKATVDWVEKTWHSIGKFFSSLGSEIGSWPGRVGAWVAKIGADIGSFVGKVVAWFESLPAKIGGFMARLPGLIGAAFVLAFDQATTAVGFGIGLVVGFFAKLPGRISDAISRIISDTISFWTAVWDNGKRVTLAGVDAVVAFFRQLPGRASAAVSSLWSSIVGHFTSAKSGAESTVQSAVNNVVGFFRTLPGRAASALSSVRSAVMGAFSGAGSWLYSAGQDILRGIANGIGSAVGFVRDAAVRAAHNIISGFKGALGISSPSQVMAEQVGKWIPAGIADGIKSGLPSLRGTVNGVALALPNQMSVALSGARITANGSGGSGGSASGTVNNYYVTLDASKVKTMRDIEDLINGVRSTARAHVTSTATIRRAGMAMS